MSVLNVTCKCGELVYKSTGSMSSKIRNRIVLIEDGVVSALCKSCGEKIDLPLKMEPIHYPPLYIRDMNKKS